MTIKQQQPPAQADVEEFDTNEYAPPIPMQRRSRQQPPVSPPTTNPALPTIEPRKHHTRVLFSPALRFIVLGVAIIVACLVIWNQLIIPAWNWSQDQWHYGDTRITQLDANVGHGGESHFIATFSHGDVVIIEIMLNAPTTNHIYTLTGFMAGAGTPVISLSVQDVNRDGKPDLLIQIEGSGYQTVLYNTGTGFSETQP